MPQITSTPKVLIYILLIFIIVASYIFFGSKLITYIIAISSVTVLAVLTLNFLYIKSKKAKLYKRLYDEYAFTSALILGAKYYKKKLVLQLQIPDMDTEYISILVMNKPYETDESMFTKGSRIDVCINPNDRHDIYSPYALVTNRKGMTILSVITTIIFGIVPFSVSIFASIFDTSNYYFQDMAYVNGSGKSQNVWMVSFENPDQIHISIYDPINKKKVKKIKVKSEKELESNTRFYICERNKNVVLVGTGLTPVLYTFNTSSYKKISDLKDFEQSHQILQTGVARMDNKIVASQYKNDDVFEILTFDGIKYYYDINQDKFFNSLNDVEKYFKRSDSIEMSEHMNGFILFINSESPVVTSELFKIESKAPTAINDLLLFSGTDNYGLDFFDHTQYKDLKLTPLQKNNRIIGGKIIWFDYDFVVLQHFSTAENTAPICITGYDKNGNVVFNIPQIDFPNIKQMKEDLDISLRNTFFDDVKRENEFMYIVFEKYGALCIQLKTGKIVWKYEP